MSATKEKQVTSKPEDDLSINNTSEEIESTLLVDSEQGDVGTAVEKTAKKEKSSKPVKRKRAKTKARQHNTPEKKPRSK